MICLRFDHRIMAEHPDMEYLKSLGNGNFELAQDLNVAVQICVFALDPQGEVEVDLKKVIGLYELQGSRESWSYVGPAGCQIKFGDGKLSFTSELMTGEVCASDICPGPPARGWSIPIKIYRSVFPPSGQSP